MSTKVIAYSVVDKPLELRPSSPRRQWMDESTDRYAYRCLPMSIANSYGWDVISPIDFSVQWDGGKFTDSVKVFCNNPQGHSLPCSVFGEGVFTLHTGHVFKTEYPYALYVTGPVNQPSHGIIPLSGIVETYWLPFSFTMNWRFTFPGVVNFRKGDVLCHIFPVNIEIFDNIEAEIKPISSNPEFEKLYKEWSCSRDDFITKKRENHPSVHGSSWQKNYFQGNHPPDGERKCPFHTTESGETKKIHKTNLNVPDFQQ
jgi:hypothetical protein